jgi:hypothetical protein
MNPNPGQRQLQKQAQDQYRRNMAAAWYMRKKEEERRKAEMTRNRELGRQAQGRPVVSNVLSNFLRSRPRRPSWPTRIAKGT